MNCYHDYFIICYKITRFQFFSLYPYFALMKATIVTIGDEILIGQIIDSNSAWIGQQLTQLGIEVYRIISISDQKEEIVKTLDEVTKEADLIIITGGLGPTKDDLTKQTLTEYFNSELVLNEEILVWVKKIFSDRNILMPDINIQQAMIPDNCIPIINHWGTAPAMYFDRGSKVFVSLPGVPHEMKGMMEGQILGMIENKFETEHIYHRTVLTQGIGESTLMEKIAPWEESLEKKNIKLAYLPQPGMVRLRLNIKGKDRITLESLIESKIDELKLLIPDYFFGYDVDKLELEVGKLLVKSNFKLATAESCTGGYLAHLITSVSGSSKYFEGSIVSYSNEIKKRQLGVSSQTLEDFGAVSEQVVIEMANGVKSAMNVDYTIATSGIAGPNGGTTEKPVGTVWIAISTPNGVLTKLKRFGNNREKNIRQTALEALSMLRKELIKTS